MIRMNHYNQEHKLYCCYSIVCQKESNINNRVVKHFIPSQVFYYIIDFTKGFHLHNTCEYFFYAVFTFIYLDLNVHTVFTHDYYISSTHCFKGVEMFSLYEKGS